MNSTLPSGPVIGLSTVEVPTLGSIILWALNYNALFTGNYVWLVAPIVATILLFLGLFLSSTGFNAAFASTCTVPLSVPSATDGATGLKPPP